MWEGAWPSARGAAMALAVESPIKGFRLLRLPVAPGVVVARSLLVKRHEGRTPEEKLEQERTLFATHLDDFVTEAQLSKCLAAFGPVERVELKTAEKRAAKAELRADGVKTRVTFARAVFREPASLKKALAAATGRLVSGTALPLPKGGLKEQLRTGREAYRDPAELRRETDEWMAGYDQREAEKAKAEKENAVDDDGFTKVVSGITRTADGMTMRSAKRLRPETGTFGQSVNDESQLQGDGKKKKKRERLDFYRFQLREKRRQDVADHRKRALEDQKKMEQMRKARRFK